MPLDFLANGTTDPRFMQAAVSDMCYYVGQQETRVPMALVTALLCAPHQVLTHLSSPCKTRGLDQDILRALLSQTLYDAKLLNIAYSSGDLNALKRAAFSGHSEFTTFLTAFSFGQNW